MFKYSTKQSIYFSLSLWHQVADANIFGCYLLCSEFFFIGTRLVNGTTQQRMLKIESSVTDFISTGHWCFQGLIMWFICSPICNFYIYLHLPEMLLLPTLLASLIHIHLLVFTLYFTLSVGQKASYIFPNRNIEIIV